MKKTLQDQYLLIKEGKGHTGVFLTEAKRQFPNIVRNAATFEEAAASLITKNIITEHIVSLGPINSPFDSKKKESYELAFENFLAEAKKKKENEDEKVKAEEKKVSKRVEEDYSHNFDNSDEKNPDNMIFDQIMMGYYAEMKDPKNADKTMQELKDMVFKNLTKDPIHYTKDGQFGVKGLGYTTEAPGLGTPKEAKGKYKASGYGDLNESIQPINEEESKLRKVIREIIDKELKEAGRGFATMGTINIGSDKKGKIFIPKYYILPPIARKKLNLLKVGENAPAYNESMRIPHIKVLPDNTILFSSYLVSALENPSDIKNPLNNILNNINSFHWDQFKIYVKKFISSTTVKYPIFDREAIYNVIDFPNDFDVEKLKDWLSEELPKQYAKLEKAESGEKGRGRPVNIESLKKFISNLENLNRDPEGGMIVVLPVNYAEETTDSRFNEASLGVIDNDVAPSYPINVPISYGDDKNVAHYSDDYEYDRQEGLLDVEDYLEKIEGMSKGDAFNYLEEMGLGNDEILTILKNYKSLSLRESVEKELIDINKEAEHEIIASKLEKVQALIDKKQSQISRLDEDEDMKDLTDAKKVKEISKDIKSLEKAKAKLEKMMNKGKAKSPRKEVIDEVDIEPTEGYLAAKEDAEQRYDEGEEIDSIISNYQNLSFDDRNMLRQDLEGKMDGMDY